MAYYVGLDVSLKTTAICVVDRDQNIVWQGSADTHPEMILNALDRWIGSIVRIGLETGSSSPWLARALKARNLPVIVMDARGAAAALKARPVKTDRADARALAEMLQSGWYTEVFVKSEESHRMKALLSARDQLVRNKRTFFGQIRGMLRPFGIRLPARQGTRKFDEAAPEPKPWKPAPSASPSGASTSLGTGAASRRSSTRSKRRFAKRPTFRRASPPTA